MMFSMKENQTAFEMDGNVYFVHVSVPATGDEGFNINTYRENNNCNSCLTQYFFEVLCSHLGPSAHSIFAENKRNLIEFSQ